MIPPTTFVAASKFIAIRSDKAGELPAAEDYYQARGFFCPGCSEYLFFSPTNLPGRFIEPHRRVARDRVRTLHPNHPDRFEMAFDPNLTA